MKTAAFIIGLVCISYKFTDGTEAEDVGLPGVQWACRDRYLWIHVTSGQMPRFEAVDENGVHSISKQLASCCGYTISTFKMDSFTTFRASYYSCFTHSQNDEVFTFRFNVMVSDGAGWISRPVSAVCSGLSWTHREIVCEEDYMEVNVNRESSCGGQRGESGQVWQTAFSQAQRMASVAWQLMFLQSDGQVSAMSVSEAQRQGYSLTATARRVVLRSQYSPPHAELMMVDGVPVEVVRVSLFFKQKLMVMMIDVSMACTVNSGSFDGTRLLWDVPRVVTPLVGEGAALESRSVSLGVEGVLLDQHTASIRGFSLVQQGGLVQIRVPFGAEGGYRKSLVVNNVYKETYVIFLLYEHVFSLLYEDGSSVDTRHRLLRVLDTPLLCRPPFSLDQTVSDDQVFRVYLGNIPADVVLEEVRINGKPLLMSDTPERGIGISPVVHVNGSQAYELQLPFEDTVVQWTYLGEGVVQYSIDINFTLTIMPMRESYYHHTFITTQVFNAFPPEITAQCSDRGITFSVVRPPRAESLWEVGIDQEPLTSQLAAQRGYRLHSDSHKTTLEVPVFSIGYTYEGINLSNFYGTFKLLLRDSKTLEVQTSTSKHCLFKTEDMIVCSADGTMTVVTTPTSTWPTVQPERTSLLDPSCGPKQTDRSRVLFEFKLDSCGTRAMVGDSYVVYENEIVHDRQLIADGPNFISRDSQFKLTVRCFYPLSGVNRLSADWIFKSETSGFGSIKVFESLKDSTNKLPARDCSHEASGNTINIPSKQVQQTPQTPATRGVPLHPGIRPQPKPGPSRFITVPGGHNKLLLSSQNLQTFPNLNLSPPHEVPLQVPAHPGHLMSQIEDRHVFGSQTDNPFPNFPPRYEQLPDGSDQLSHLNTPSYDFTDMRGKDLRQAYDHPAFNLDSSGRIPPVVEQLENSWGDDVWHSGRTWDQFTVGQNGIIKPNEDLESQSKVYLSSGMREVSQPHELTLSHFRSSVAGMEMANTEERSGYQPQSQYDPSQTPQLYPVLQTPAQYSQDHIGSTKLHLPDTTYVPTVDATHITSKNTIPDLSGDALGTSQHLSMESNETKVHQNLERTGSIKRRNVKTIQSRVQNIRVKPLRKLASSGHHLSQKPSIQPADLRSSSPSQYTTGQTAASSDGNHRMSQHVPDPRGSNTINRTHSPERPGTLRQEQGVHSVRVKPDQSAVIRLTDLSPNQQGHQQTLVQSVAETGNSGGQQSASAPRKVLQPAGSSHIRVRPAPGLPGGLQTPYQSRLQNLDSVTRGGTSRTPPFSLTLQNLPKSPLSIKEYKPTNPNTSSPGSHTGPGSSGSDLKIHTRSDCSGQYGVSVHRGIMRGKRI